MNPQTLAWLRLLRLPSVFTALSNVSIGYFIADAGVDRVAVWIGLLLASAPLYLAGMVLNDYYDRDLDARERPERPIPSGAIAPAAAARAGYGLLVVGIAIAGGVSVLAQNQSPTYLQPVVFAVTLALAVLVYDRWTKGTILGPFTMGICRALNVLMGVAVTQVPQRWDNSTPWLVAGGIGLYVMGVTWFATDEAEMSRRHILVGGLSLMLIGLLMLIVFPTAPDFDPQLRHVRFTQPWVWPLLLCLFTGGVWARAAKATATRTPTDVQATVKQALVTLLSIDAVLALVLAGPVYALIIVALMVPANLLARKIAIT